jgi:ABC-2 type transport system ATP-binding protein
MISIQTLKEARDFVLLEVKHITGGYTDLPVIHDISLQVNQGQMIGLIGMNGAGKSTIIKHILGLLRPHSGEIQINGTELNQDPMKFRSQISYIPETPKLYEELTLWEHLELTRMVYRLDEATFQTRSKRLLDVFRMSDKVDLFPNTFSKGMQQKVMILCAFLVEPALLIVDEPFVGLDPLAIQSLLELLVEMKEQGAAILLSTHILGMAEKYCDGFVLVNSGKVALHGTLQDMRVQAQNSNATLDELFVQVVRG